MGFFGGTMLVRTREAASLVWEYQPWFNLEAWKR